MLIMGEDELASGTVRVKDLETGEQRRGKGEQCCEGYLP